MANILAAFTFTKLGTLITVAKFKEFFFKKKLKQATSLLNTQNGNKNIILILHIQNSIQPNSQLLFKMKPNIYIVPNLSKIKILYIDPNLSKTKNHRS